jgi:hypothetical protein
MIGNDKDGSDPKGQKKNYGDGQSHSEKAPKS